MSAARTKLQRKATKTGKRFPTCTLIFDSYGVRILIESNVPEAITACREIVEASLPSCHTITSEDSDVHHRFTIVWNESGRDSLYKNGEPIALGTRRATVLGMLAPRIRLTVAEYADAHAFLHAGVVVWKGKALVIPGESMHGKTTLVAEFVKRGALYYSDEYAIFDKEGSVHPFAKTLSIRGGIDAYRQVEFSASALGGKVGAEGAEVGIILVTKYVPGARWQPKAMSSANGIVGLIRNSISIRRSPEFVLSVLKKVADRADFVESDRGDAPEVVDSILGMLERKASLGDDGKMPG